MSVVRGTSLSNYSRLVSDLGADPAALLAAAGLEAAAVGADDIFVPLPRVVTAIESAATATGHTDFGRRLAQLQGIEILGPVGVAARTAPTVGEALQIFENFLSAYSPAISLRAVPHVDGQLTFIEYAVLDPDLPPHPQADELSLGVTLRVLRFLLGSDYAPLSVHIPHPPLGDTADYREYFGCRAVFSSPTTGFTIRSTDLLRPLRRDRLAHDAVVQYLASITNTEPRTSTSVGTLVRQLLPSGTVTLQLIAQQLRLHPKTLQRRLADDGTTFAAVVDQVRRDLAERYLRDSRITLSHLTRALGYAEQSVLTRSCHRWFGSGPSAYRTLRESADRRADSASQTWEADAHGGVSRAAPRAGRARPSG